jgi:hypothetical protein
VSVRPGILEKKLFKNCKKWQKKEFSHFLLASKIYQKTFSKVFFDKNWCKPTQRTEKNSKMGILIICAKIMDCPKLSKFWKKQFTQMFITLITSSKINIFELFKNKNQCSNICPPTDFRQFLSLSFENFAVSIENSYFFQKRAKKSKFLNSVENEKKTISEKVLLRSSYIHWENQCSKSQPNRRWSLVANYLDLL